MVSFLDVESRRMADFEKATFMQGVALKNCRLAQKMKISKFELYDILYLLIT